MARDDELLDRALCGFVDAAMTGDDHAAVRCFADPQAFGLARVRTEAELWAEVERRAADELGDDEPEPPR